MQQANADSLAYNTGTLLRVRTQTPGPDHTAVPVELWRKLFQRVELNNSRGSVGPARWLPGGHQMQFTHSMRIPSPIFTQKPAQTWYPLSHLYRTRNLNI